MWQFRAYEAAKSRLWLQIQPESDRRSSEKQLSVHKKRLLFVAIVAPKSTFRKKRVQQKRCDSSIAAKTRVGPAHRLKIPVVAIQKVPISDTTPPPKWQILEKGGVHGPKSAKNGQNPPKTADLEKGGCRSGGGGLLPHQKIAVRVPPLLHFETLVLPWGGPSKIMRFQQKHFSRTPPKIKISRF